ncbi:TPA: aspartate aminotransferase family protein [Candidatus Poribacteria bacterium]|nr:aspartate aminotransferase family protein [Candidatus Poribacteria bacterium]HIB85647.1 aspartate aminotransferase family protein [Candidatus Poribacteria bacterium]HIC00253.1 aspartate aminotransferase family protein [Candidatus Poribacteria bacterium]HIN31898.1 aspartate aminotransferase family protein [Candidatus Poribacteria bacterium]HIO06289.1 aspartate aminotransferase family protein [Candidatus Poribacteria bacterium]
MPDEDLTKLRTEGDLNISPLRSAWSAENIDSQTQKLLDQDSKYFLHQSLSTPCLNVLSKCDGIYIEDINGNRIMDFHGNNVHQVGFGNPDVVEAIKSQIDQLSFCTRRYTNLPAIKLAQKLVEITSGQLNKVLFAPSGSLAVGMALKLARVVTGRFKTISLWDSFHGAGLDTISIGGEAIFRNDIGPLLPGTEHVPPPYPSTCVWECGQTCNLKCANYIEYVLEKEGDVGAVIAETIRSTSITPPPEYWKTVREACSKHGALLILDEIPHSLGRTGKMFTYQHYGIVPDMLVIGKGLGGGIFPLAALITREDFDITPDRALGHYTHEKNPVACAAGLAAIEYTESEGLVKNAETVGEYAIHRLQTMMDTYDIIGAVRGMGLLIGVELVKTRQSMEPAIDQAERVMYMSLSKGLNFKVTMGNILTLTPPLTITKQEMDKAIDILSECFSQL